jgi:hypothetical protein
LIVSAGYTNSEGDVILVFDPFDAPTELTLTVTGYNKITHVGVVPVEDASSAAEIPRIWTDACTGSRPNPWHEGARIHFSLSRGTKTTLEIYNVSGERIRTLVNGTIAEGAHSVPWDGLDEHGRAVSTGIYGVLLQTEKVTRTAKILVVR